MRDPVTNEVFYWFGLVCALGAICGGVVILVALVVEEL